MVRISMVVCLVAALAIGARLEAQHVGEGLWPSWDLSGLRSSAFASGISPGFSDLLGSEPLQAGVVLLNGQCTGTFISADGLLLTNHHCLLAALDGSNTKGESLLRDGFWAADRSKERRLESLSAWILRRTEQVTDQVIPPGENLSQDVLSVRLADLEAKASAETGLKVEIKSFDAGSRFVMYYFEALDDVRLVGLPPEPVARLGGEESYGKWPMAAADFALLRLYQKQTTAQGKPVLPNPVFHPDHFFKASHQPRSVGAPVMTLGFPGFTNLYQSSAELRAQAKLVMPVQIRMSEGVRDVLLTQMGRSRLVERDYGSVFRALSTSSRSISVLHANILGRGIIDTIAVAEAALLANAPAEMRASAMKLLSDLQSAHTRYAEKQAQSLAIRLLVNWSGILRLARSCDELNLPVSGKSGQRLWALQAKMVRQQIRQHFHNDHPDTDRRILAVLVKVVSETLPQDNQPPILIRARKRHHGDFNRWAAHFCKHSAFASEDRLLALLEGLEPNETKRLNRDPAIRLLHDINQWHTGNLASSLEELEDQLAGLNRAYLEMRIRLNPMRRHFPDANGSLRYSFGEVAPFPGTQSAVSGIENMLLSASQGRPELPKGIQSALESGHWDEAGAGEPALCFLAAMHTSNGNSGSPVLDAAGNLMGINMARTEEGWLSDVYFDPATVRAVVLDYRYVMFVTEALCRNAGLIAEMQGN